MNSLSTIKGVLQPKTVLHIFLLAIVYFVAARLGLKLALVANSVTLIWPPTGLALAAFLLFGVRLWPGVFIGAFTANLATGLSLQAAIGIGIGNTLEGLAGYWLLQRFGFSTQLDRVRDVFALILFGALVSTTVSATIGTSVLAIEGLVNWQAFANAWLLWWMGDAMGDVVFAALFLAWASKRHFDCTPPCLAEALTLVVFLIAVSELVFGNLLSAWGGSYPIAFITFPFLIWGAWRFGQRGATAATFLISMVVLWNVVHNIGLFAFDTPVKSLSILWLFANVLAATGLIVAASVSERRRAEDKLRLAASVFENTSEAVMITDDQSCIVSVNRAFTEITGYSVADVLGKNPKILGSGRHDREFYERLWNSVASYGHWHGEIWDRRKSGEIYPAWLALSVSKDETGRITNYISISSDISERKQAEAHIQHLAQHDALTGLPNRMLLQDRIAQALVHAGRQHIQVGILFMDLDRFKVINDTLGHEIGDVLLVMVAERLKHCVRQEDTVGRQGGDEFLIVLHEMAHSQDAALVAQKVVSVVSEPYQVRGYELHITPSIGISIYPADGTDAGALMKNADTAMYHAKRSGGTYRFYAAEMNASAFKRLTVENSLRHALERNEFVLHYQPLIELETGRIFGTEALIRWQHPEMGLVAPDVFIPIAEETGLIIPIGEWVVREACRQCSEWHKIAGSRFKVAVNISARQFWQGNLMETLGKILREDSFDPSCLELELTESMLMRHTDETVDMLNQLSSLGLRISIDDFGTGYSSLSYLKRFPIHKLKIDRSFICDVTHDPDDAAITQAVIAMARSLKLVVIAEGVETAEQLAYLRSQQCDEGQGYYFSKPLPAAACTELLRVGKVSLQP